MLQRAPQEIDAEVSKVTREFQKALQSFRQRKANNAGVEVEYLMMAGYTREVWGGFSGVNTRPRYTRTRATSPPPLI